MMNDCVPDFGVEQEDPLFSLLGSPNRRIRPETNCDELAEILWQKGPVFRRFPPHTKAEESPPPPPPPGIHEGPCELFMGDDELTQWLHQPVEDREELDSGVHPPPTALAPPMSRASTVIESNEIMPFDRMITSGSLSGGDGRKRKAVRLEQQSDNEAAEHDSFENKRRDAPRPARRTRAAEVHNLSERRRRDRINEKMKALQQLIPRCNKTDKASMLDDAVEYLKSLQLQIQMMSMGCAMPPMMYPGIPPMGMLMGMPFPHAPVAGMPMQTLRPPQVFADGKPSESMSGQSMNIPSPFFPYFAMQQMPPPQQDHAGTSKSTVETEKPLRSS